MADEEEWRPIDGWPYEVSSLGRVRRSAAAMGTRVGKILRPARDAFGYPNVALFRQQEQRRIHVHALVCNAFHGSRPTAQHEVAHNDGNPANVSAENLRWDTHRGNMADRAAHGTENIGEKNGQARLVAADVMEIRRLVSAGEDRSFVAARFGIHKNSLDQIVRRDRWKHV